MRILIVEDDPDVADLLSRSVQHAAWAPDTAGTGEAALAALAVNDYDAVVLDVNLPDMTGLEVCRRWRTSGGQTPLLMLTARAEIEDRVGGLDAGADDYLTKPFVVDELLARLRALIRRPPTTATPTLRLADVELFPDTRSVRVRGEAVRLTAREYALLEYLMRNPHRMVSRARILDHVWDDNFDPVANAVDVLVGRVRRKLDGAGCRPVIHTIRGGGYILTDREFSRGR